MFVKSKGLTQVVRNRASLQTVPSFKVITRDEPARPLTRQVNPPPARTLGRTVLYWAREHGCLEDALRYLKKIFRPNDRAPPEQWSAATPIITPEIGEVCASDGRTDSSEGHDCCRAHPEPQR